MTQSDEIGSIFSALHHTSEGLSLHEQDKLVDILSNLLVLLSEHSSQDVESRENALRQISIYISKKNKEISPLERNAEVDSLRNLRNLIVHGKLNLRSNSEIRAYEPVVWRAITRSADKWHPLELSNFLAYCIGVREANIDLNTATPRKIINSYRTLFSGLDERHKVRAFEELLMRLYSDPRMREILQS